MHLILKQNYFQINTNFLKKWASFAEMNNEIALDSFTSLTKLEKYVLLHSQWKVLYDNKSDSVCNLSNGIALLKQIFDWWWVGVYRVNGEQLMLGVFQGPPACTNILKGKGVCGLAWEQGNTLVVDDVREFPGHIACSWESISEIVIPIRLQSGEIWGVLDADSRFLSHFDATDKIELEEFCRNLGVFLSQ